MEHLRGEHHVRHIFEFLRSASDRGRRTALVTIVDLKGSSMRALGTHMAVAEDGTYAGSFSGGCIEAAVVAEARGAIVEDRDRLVRFGAGSPFIDLKLPCGGGVELLIQPAPQAHFIAGCMDQIEKRKPLKLLLRAGEPRMEVLEGPREETGPQEDGFRVWHAPSLKLVIAGQGEEGLSLARLATSFGAEICLLSPDRRILDAAEPLGVASCALKSPASAVLETDPWTAIILLFHDHDWEPLLLEQALAGPAFFIGAMGSRATHQARLERLRSGGIEEELLQRVRGPIGLIPSTRDPSMLALSVLAEVAAEYRKLAA